MNINPIKIAEDYVEDTCSPFGAIHPESIVDFPEVFQFGITSKSYLNGSGNSPIGLGPTLISKLTGRIHQFGSGHFSYLIDFLITECKFQKIGDRYNIIHLEKLYQLNISKVYNSPFFEKYFKALLKYCSFSVLVNGKVFQGEESTKYKTRFYEEWKLGNVRLPPLKGFGLVDFIFYNSIHNFCEFTFEEDESEELSLDPTIQSLSSINLNSKYENQISSLYNSISNLDELEWMEIDDFDSFILFQFYSENGVNLTDPIKTVLHVDAIILNRENNKLMFLDSLSTIRSDYQSTSLFIEYEEQQISKAISTYQGAKGKTLVIEEIYDYELLIQNFNFLRSSFTYNKGEKAYSKDPMWNWNYYFNDIERLKNKLNGLPAKFNLLDYETSIYFIYSNIEKRFCKLGIER